MPSIVRPQRLFIALWPGPAARAATSSWQAAQPWPAGSKLVPADQLHVTLHFLGDVSTAALPVLLQALGRVSARHLRIDFDRLDLWNRGVAVLTACAKPAPLSALHADLAHALRPLGLPVDDRPYRPHVTLARRATGLVAIEQPPARWITSSFRLVVSAGGTYRHLAAFPSRR